MPRLDRTGPSGYGPRTGLGFGFCRGCRRYVSSGDELATLEQEEKMLQEELEAVRKEKLLIKGK